MTDGAIYLRATLALQTNQIDVEEFDEYVDYLRDVEAGRAVEWSADQAPYAPAPATQNSPNGGHA